MNDEMMMNDDNIKEEEGKGILNKQQQVIDQKHNLSLNLQYIIVSWIWSCQFVPLRVKLLMSRVSKSWHTFVCRCVNKLVINTSIFESSLTIQHLESRFNVMSKYNGSTIPRVTIQFNDPDLVIDDRFRYIISLIITKATVHISFVKLHSGGNRDIYATLQVMQELLAPATSGATSQLRSLAFKFYSFYLNNHLEDYSPVVDILMSTGLYRELTELTLYVASLHFDTHSFIQLLQATPSLESLRLSISHVDMTQPAFLNFFAGLTQQFGGLITWLRVHGGVAAPPHTAAPFFARLCNLQTLRLDVVASSSNVMELDAYASLLTSSAQTLTRVDLRKPIDDHQLSQLPLMPRLRRLTISLSPSLRSMVRLLPTTSIVTLTNLGSPEVFAQFLLANPHIERLDLGPFVSREDILHLSYYIMHTRHLRSLALFSDKSTGERGQATALSTLTTAQINQTCTDSSIKFLALAMATNRTLTHIHTPLRSDFYFKTVLSLIGRANTLPRIYSFEILSTSIKEKLVDSLQYPSYEYKMNSRKYLSIVTT